MILRIAAAASAELTEAVEWYEAARAGLGSEFQDEFETGIRQIASFPRAWKPLGDRVRCFLLNRFPYGIIYQVETEEILILAVAHMHRRPGYWRDRLERP